MELFQAGKKDLEDIVALAHALFEGNEMEALRAEMEALLHDADAAIFLCRLEGMAVGFAQCQLRRDYVEGAKSSPVGYLEGIYVKETCRRQGIARALLQCAEAWAKEKGCRELASDCTLETQESLRFHQNVGFAEANRIICFIKRL